VPIVIRSRETQLGARTNPKSNERLGEIESAARVIARIEQTVFGLEHPVRNDCAGIGDGGPVSRDRCRSIDSIESLRRGDRNETRADEQSRPARSVAREAYDSHIYQSSATKLISPDRAPGPNLLQKLPSGLRAILATRRSISIRRYHGAAIAVLGRQLTRRHPPR
jgi:hypothetical protein